MGTFQQALAGMDLRGKDADMLIWDSSMTEKNGYMTDFFFRQGLLAGNRAPFLYSGYGANPAAFEEIGVSTGSYGQLGYSPITTSEEQAKTLPWAARFDKCESGANALCAAKEYDGKCWVEREDFTPEAKQNELVGGQAKWHPGPKKVRKFASYQSTPCDVFCYLFFKTASNTTTNQIASSSRAFYRIVSLIHASTRLKQVGRTRQ